MPDEDEEYYILDLVDSFPFLRHELADLLRRVVYDWKFIPAGHRREGPGWLDPDEIIGRPADDRYVKFFDGILDGADVSTDANLEQFPLRKLRCLTGESYSDFRPPLEDDCRVDTEKQIQQLASLDIEELQLFLDMPNADRVCQLLQEAKPTRLGWGQLCTSFLN